jgi:hypothetical protein
MYEVEQTEQHAGSRCSTKRRQNQRAPHQIEPVVGRRSVDLQDVAKESRGSRPSMQQMNPMVRRRTARPLKDVAAMESGADSRAWVVGGGEARNRAARSNRRRGGRS